MTFDDFYNAPPVDYSVLDARDAMAMRPTSTPTTTYSPANSSSFPSGQSITDALIYGFGRWVDYRTRPEPVQNTQMQLPPTYMTQPTGLGGLVSGDLLMLFIIGGAIYALAK